TDSTTTQSPSACKLRYIGMDAVAGRWILKVTIFGIFFWIGANPPQHGKIDTDEDYSRTHVRRPGGGGCPDRTGLRRPERRPFRRRRLFRLRGNRRKTPRIDPAPPGARRARRAGAAGGGR